MLNNLRHLRRPWVESHDVLLQVVLAVMVGVITGLGALVFRWLIDFFQDLFFRWAPAQLGPIPLPLLPAFGGLLVGLLVYYGAREARGHGVPEVMAAVAQNGGRIRGRVAAVKALASALTIGSGGSAGREGPIVQIGASLGSALGQRLRLREERVILLVACGAAAGISATFNAPVAGVFFALEVILGEFATRSFSMVVLSSVTAGVISRAMLGDVPAFVAPRHALIHPSELGWYVVLGLLAAVVGVAYSRAMGLSERLFARLRLPEPVKPAVGGFMVGALALWFPQVMGNGYDTITAALHSDLDVLLMASLVGAKIVATALTLGSGGSGGVFAPALYVGAVLGGAFGGWVHGVAPHHTAEGGAYALVGMAAVFAASSHAPITAVLILFELTGDYRIILPLMAATVVATLVAGLLDRDSIYTAKLRARGLTPRSEEGPDNPMRRVLVGEVMTRDFEMVAPDMPLVDLAALFDRTGHHGFPVVDGRGRLLGMVSRRDLEYAALREETLGEGATVRSIATFEPGFACPEDSLHFALRVMGRLGVGRLPVVESPQARHLLGVLRRADIIDAYNRQLQSGEVQEEVARLKVRTSSEADFLEIALPGDTPWDGVAVRDLGLPHEAVLVAVRRGADLIIPRGDTVLEAGDAVVAFSRPATRPELRRLLGAHRGAHTNDLRGDRP